MTLVDLSKRRFFSKRSNQNQFTFETGTRLPWAKPDADFTDACTQCGECLKACETQIITKGVGGFPTVDFEKGECTFCQKCADICPENAFLATNEAPWQITAKINETCLAYQNVECRTCAEECEPRAIQFSHNVGRVAQPKLDSELCTGCGACLSVCPVSAISMTDSNKDNHAGQ
jgi:ferredoxin-type protein NapF